MNEQQPERRSVQSVPQGQCATMEERMPWFLNGSLDPHERGLLREHLDACAGCRESLAWWRELGHTVETQASDAEAAAEVPSPDRLLERVGRQQRDRERRRLLLAASVMLGLASLLAALLTNAFHEPRFITVTEVAQPGRMLQVELQFTENTRLSDLAALLEQTDAVLESGPDGDGWARLSLPLQEEETADALLARLAASEQVLVARVAEPGQPGDESRP